jgi:hypothetical protein
MCPTFDPEDEDIMLPQNKVIQSTSDTALHPRRAEASATLLQKPKTHIFLSDSSLHPYVL